MIRKHQQWINVMIATGDALILFLAYAGALWSKESGDLLAQNFSLYAATPFWLIPLSLLAYYLSEVYVPMRGTTYRKEALLIIRAHLIALCCCFAVFYLFKMTEFSRQVLIVYWLLGLFLLLVERGLLRRTLKRLRSVGYNKKYVLIVGVGRRGKSFAKRMLKNRHFGYSLLGFLDDNPHKENQRFFSRPVMGRVSDLPLILETTTVDMVVAALPSTAYHTYSDLVRWCDNEGVRLRVIPDYYDIFSDHPRIEEFDGMPLLNIRYVSLDEPLNRALKRALDVVVSLTAILLTMPLMLLIAVGIKLTSPGPVFFRQTRVGFNGREFCILKFRTMRVANNESDSTWTTSCDPRKVFFGSFLRRTSLDEFPQFFNVLRGDMSVVGPRPERPHFVQKFKRDIPKYMIKHQVKPGITGWAQVNGWRGDTSIERRIDFDIHYIENWDIFFDIKILFLTCFRGFINKNAY